MASWYAAQPRTTRKRARIPYCSCARKARRCPEVQTLAAPRIEESILGTPAQPDITLAWSAYIGQRVHGIAFLSLFSQWEMKDIHVEEAREMYGLLIVAVWMAAIAVASWRRNYNRPFAPG